MVLGGQRDALVVQCPLAARQRQLEGVVAPGGREQHHPRHQVGAGQRQLLRHPRAEGRADDVRPAAQRFDQRGRVADQVRQPHAGRALVGRRDAPVVEGGDPEPGGAQRGHLVRVPHPPGAPGAHHEHDEVALAVDLVAEVDPVERDDRHGRQASAGRARPTRSPGSGP
ncbi:hypothetical protein GCM10018963_41450 [Saccharothrix longispora]